MSKANGGKKHRRLLRRRKKAWKRKHNRDICASCKGSLVRVSYGRGLKAHVACHCVRKGHPGRRW